MFTLALDTKALSMTRENCIFETIAVPGISFLMVNGVKIFKGTRNYILYEPRKRI